VEFKNNINERERRGTLNAMVVECSPIPNEKNLNSYYYVFKYSRIP
jgi:hypothetical protein